MTIIFEECHPCGRPRWIVFHATELFSGGKYFNRDVWLKEQRWEILDRLAAIPAEFDLPIAVGTVRRAQIPPDLDGPLLKYPKATAEYSIGFTVCSVDVERWMRQQAGDQEVAVLIAEDRPEIRRAVKGAHEMCKRPDKLKALGVQEIQGLPLTRIVDTVHFAGKDECRLLQIADVCAFAIKRRVANEPHAERFFAPLSRQIVR